MPFVQRLRIFRNLRTGDRHERSNPAADYVCNNDTSGDDHAAAHYVRNNDAPNDDHTAADHVCDNDHPFGSDAGDHGTDRCREAEQ